jgi:hypothetical protein
MPHVPNRTTTGFYRVGYYLLFSFQGRILLVSRFQRYISEILGPVHPAYNSSFLACFFSQNSIFLSPQISQQCFSAKV